MNMFYNRNGVGDVLMVAIGDVNRENRLFEKKGDVVRIYDGETNQTVGFNLFNASAYHRFEEQGKLELTEALGDTVNQILEKNGFERVAIDLSPKFVVGYVVEKEKHENADKLSVCKVDVGGEQLQIVCGAPNVDKGQKVVVAKVGAVMPSGLVIKDAELRGVQSSGMICSARELDLPDAPKEKGILVLSDDYQVGEPFFK